MKDIFPGYNRKSEKNIKKIWEKGIIMFDTNVLLNLYRYSNSTRETILDLIKKFQDRIWLPHQSALEYNKNRYEVIAAQEKAYKEFTEKITQIQKDLQSSSKPPFLSKSVHKDLNKVFKKVNSEVADSIKKYCDYLIEDPIYENLSKLFKSRITEPFNNNELKEIYIEGEKRYKSKIPPGFEDEKNKDGNRKYGDLVLWKQVIKKAKEENKPVILITDERKKDWWWKIKDGRNMGPRQELIEEIKNIANVDFYMYSSERFLSFGQHYLKEKINQDALNEIQEMKKAEIEHIKDIQKRTVIENQKIRIEEKINNLIYNKNQVQSKILEINSHQNELREEAINNPDIQEYIHNLSIEKVNLKNEFDNLSKEIFELNQKLSYNSNIRKKILQQYLNLDQHSKNKN